MATEKRLSSLDEALEATHKEVFWTESEQAAVRSFLVKQPKVDAVEVVHGRWVWHDGCFHCTNCKATEDHITNYCPNCGAGMRGDGNV